MRDQSLSQEEPRGSGKLGKLQRAIAAIVGEAQVTGAIDARRAAARDALRSHRVFSGSALPASLPALVAFPRSTDEVSQVVSLAAANRVPIIPYGGGSGLMGGAASAISGLVVDLRQMDKIVEIDEHDRSVTVQAGARIAQVKEAVNSLSLDLAHDPWSVRVSTIGGAISTNAVGYRASKYGSIADQILGLKVVLPSGAVMQTRPVTKTSTGPAIHRLFVGAEGLLGIITEAMLKVVPVPEVLRVRAFGFDSFSSGYTTLLVVLHSGIIPAVIDLGEEFSSSFSGLVRPCYRTGASATLYLGFEGTAEEVAALEHAADRILLPRGAGVLPDEFAESYWRDRYRVGDEYEGKRKSDNLGYPEGLKIEWITLALPPSQVLRFREYCISLLSQTPVKLLECDVWTAPELLSMTIALQVDDDGDATDVMAQLFDKILRAAQDAGGSMEAVHGVGMKLAHLLRRELGEEGFGLLRALKDCLDPLGIMNPGKMGL